MKGRKSECGAREEVLEGARPPMVAGPAGGAGLPATGSGMLSDVAWLAIAGSLDLSSRHLEIVRAVFDDAKETTIADDCGISVHTVHTHIGRIYQKLNVHDRVELVQRIIVEFLRVAADMTNGVPPVCDYWISQKCPMREKLGAKASDGVSLRQPTPA